MNTVEFDEERMGEAAVEASVPDLVDEIDEADAMLPISVMAELVRGLLSLSPEQLQVVLLRYAGLMYREIAVKQGVTPAAAEVRLTRAMKKWPALQAFFSGKARKQKSRCRSGSKARVAPKAHHGAGGWRRCGGGYMRSTGPSRSDKQMGADGKEG